MCNTISKPLTPVRGNAPGQTGLGSCAALVSLQKQLISGVTQLHHPVLLCTVLSCLLETLLAVDSFLSIVSLWQNCLEIAIRVKLSEAAVNHRSTERFVLDGAFKDRLVHPPAMDRDIFH